VIVTAIGGALAVIPEQIPYVRRRVLHPDALLLSQSGDAND